MSKSLLVAKIVGGAVAGTGTVVVGGLAINGQFKSKESTPETKLPSASPSPSPANSTPTKELGNTQQSTDLQRTTENEGATGGNQDQKTPQQTGIGDQPKSNDVSTNGADNGSQTT